MTTTVIKNDPSSSASALTVYFGTFERLLADLLFYIDVKDAMRLRMSIRGDAQ